MYAFPGDVFRPGLLTISHRWCCVHWCVNLLPGARFDPAPRRRWPPIYERAPTADAGVYERPPAQAPRFTRHWVLLWSISKRESEREKTRAVCGQRTAAASPTPAQEDCARLRLNASRQSDAHQLRRQSLHCSWTSSLELSADGPQTAGLVIQTLQSLKTFLICQWGLSAVWIPL